MLENPTFPLPEKSPASSQTTKATPSLSTTTAPLKLLDIHLPKDGGIDCPCLELTPLCTLRGHLVNSFQYSLPKADLLCSKPCAAPLLNDITSSIINFQ